MSKFEEREKSFEKKFAKDQELQFKVAARSNKYLAEWVSSKLGKNEEEKKIYIQELIKSDMEESGTEDVFRKVKDDLKNYNHDSQIGLNSGSYENYIKALTSVWKECVRVLAPDGKICINTMPFFLSGDEARFDRRETKLSITDIARFMDSTNEMYQFGLYIWDKRKIVRFSSFGSYPYPTNIFSTFPYEWITVFSKKGKREKVSKEIKEQT